MGKYRSQSSVEIMINETFHVRGSELRIRNLEGRHSCLAPIPDGLTLAVSGREPCQEDCGGRGIVSGITVVLSLLVLW